MIMDSNKSLEEIYNYRFFRQRHKLMWRMPVICEPIASLTRAKSVVDIGCAIGDLVKGFLDLGLDAWGIEGSTVAKQYLVAPLERIVFTDIRFTSKQEAMDRQFDVVLCLEVLEHIEKRYEDHILQFLSELADDWIIVSAAPPGCLGTNHVNLNTAQYWIDRFIQLGFVQDIPVRQALLGEWEPYRHGDGVRAYYEHTLVFRRKHGKSR